MADPDATGQQDATDEPHRQRGGGGRVLLLAVGAVAATVLVITGIISLVAPGGPASSSPTASLVGTSIRGFVGDTLPALSSGRVRAPWTSHRGTVLLFFADWCAPCHRELPSLAPLAGSGSLGTVRVIGVDEDASRATGTSFVAAMGLKVPVAWDHGEAAAARLGLPGYPSSVAVDAHGTIVAVHFAGLTTAQFRAEVAAADAGGVTRQRSPG